MRLARLLASAVAVVALVAATTGSAVARGLIRDAEIERTIRMMADPIFDAAGLGPDAVDIYIRQDPAVNAFVGGGRAMVLNTGLLQRFENPGAVIGVIAHETGHVTGGHVTRRAITAREFSGPAAIAVALGAAAAAASGSGQAGAAVALGGQQALQRAFLAYTRAEEAAADQAGVAYMTRAGFDPAGMLEVLKLFRGQEVFQSARADPWARTHPMSAERMSLLENKVAESRARGAAMDPEIAYWHERMRAKLDGFIDRPERVLSRLDTAAEPDSEINLYRRAIAEFRMSETDRALATLDRLLKLRPKDPFYRELRGQILFESGRPAEAVPAYREAVALAPDEPLIAGALGRALLASGQDDEALKVLERAARDDPGDARVLRDLATAYGRAGRDGDAALATAERMALAGQFEDAAIQAGRAMDLLPRGSPGWRRAEDIDAAARLAHDRD
jgi:predicted Zn-dependent protease